MIRSLLILSAVGVVLPIAIVASDRLLLSVVGAHENANAAFFVLLVAQTALMSYVSGKWLGSWFPRLVVLGWAIVLLNALLFDKSVIGQREHNAFWPTAIPFAFVATQISFGLIWLTLGPGRWQWRIPSALLPVLPAGFLFAELARNEEWAGDIWNEITVLQAAFVLALSFAMRRYGFRIINVREQGSAEGPPGARKRMQFSVAQLLFWTAVVAPFLLLAQSIQYATPEVYGLQQWAIISVYAILLALVAIASLCAGLGARRLSIGLVALAAIAAMIGFALWGVEDHFGTRSGWVPAFGRPVWTGDAFVTRFTDAGARWLVWTELSAFLFIGVLLALRINSYRVVRCMAHPLHASARHFV